MSEQAHSAVGLLQFLVAVEWRPPPLLLSAGSSPYCVKVSQIPGFLTSWPSQYSKQQQCMSPSPTLNLPVSILSFGSRERKFPAFKGLMWKSWVHFLGNPGKSLHFKIHNQNLHFIFITIHNVKVTLHKVKVMSLSRVWLFGTPWTVAYQAPLSMWFSRWEYWSGLSLPSPGDLPDPGIEAGSPALQVASLPSEPPGKQASRWRFQYLPEDQGLQNFLSWWLKTLIPETAWDPLGICTINKPPGNGMCSQLGQLLSGTTWVGLGT